MPCYSSMRMELVLCFMATAALIAPSRAMEGDVLAATDFRRGGGSEWTLAGSGWSPGGIQQESDLIAALDAPSSPGSIWYYSAPKSFLGGDKTLAYNGWLTFDLGHFEYESMGQPPMAGYDVYLQSKNKKLTLGLQGVFQLNEQKLSNSYAVRLEEAFFPPNSTARWELVNVKKPVNGKFVTKAPTQHEFVSCLQSLSGIWIRGSYFQGPEATWLRNVKILQGALNKGSETGAVHTVINGTLVNGPAITPPTATSDCCASRTCVTNDKYEILFDRPGCMQAPDMYCCMGSPTSDDACTKYAKWYDQSKAAEIIRGTDYNEGRAFMTPGRVDRCYGSGTGVGGPAYSDCYDGTSGTTPSVSNQRASWDSATKNQNIGMKGIPIQKPFVKDYYMSSVPRICSSATLTVTAHGDLAYEQDSIYVYGEDEQFLGTLFAGNISYMQEGQRPYDPMIGPGTECNGPYDPTVVGSDAFVRLGDSNRPDGKRPRVRGYRGGSPDAVTPGVFGHEDTQCTSWASQLFGNQPLSEETSESTPYVDSIAIPQDKMMLYSADEQIKFTFRSVRADSTPNTFSGTFSGGRTAYCSFASGANACGAGTSCSGCNLDGKVIFRSMKLKYSAANCFVKRLSTDHLEEFQVGLQTPQPLNVSFVFRVPDGVAGTPGGDATLSVVAGADIFSMSSFISVFSETGEKLGDLFRKESKQGLRSHMSADFMVKTGSFGSVDSPVPFHPTTDCDTSSPITQTDKCTPSDTRWNMGDTFVNYTDTILIPRATLLALAKDGMVRLTLGSDVPGNSFSQSAGGGAVRLSPVTLAYPLMNCFMTALKSGPNFGIYLNRPESYYFNPTGFPMPAGDVTFFLAAHWQQHVRYVTRHVGQAISMQGGFAYDGLQDGLPVMRVDKDTVSDLGTIWEYRNGDGSLCCPAAARPTVANKPFSIQESSNCLDGGCYNPDDDTSDTCTLTAPCAGYQLTGATTPAGGLTMTLSASEFGGAISSILDDVYRGFTIYFSSALRATGTGASSGITNTASTVPCGSAAATLTLTISVASGGYGGRASASVTLDGAGMMTLNSVNVITVGQGFTAAPIVTCPTCLAACDATFTAVLKATVIAGTSRTIVGYRASTRTVVLDSNHADIVGANAAAATDVYYRISADAVSSFPKNTINGGTSTGSVAVRLDANAVCRTNTVLSGVIETATTVGGVTNARLDSGASLAWNAYTSLTMIVSGILGATQSLSITSYAGNITGSITAYTSNQYTTVTVSLYSAVTCPYCAVAASQLYISAQIDIDIDGSALTGYDIYSGTITSYSSAGVVTCSGGFTRISNKGVTETLSATSGRVIASGVSTYEIYSRMATLSTTATTALPAFAVPSTTTLGSSAAIGATSVNLNAAYSAYADNYFNGFIIRLTNSIETQQKKIISWTSGSQLAVLDSPLTSAVSTTTTYQIYYAYSIYQDLGTSCLNNVMLKVTYTAGIATVLSNDPGGIDTAFSSWDSSSGRITSGSSLSPQSARSWVLKLEGAGYYQTLNPAQGPGAMSQDGTTLTVAVLTSDTSITVASVTGISPGMYLLLTDRGAASPLVEIVLVTGVVASTKVVTVTRAQKNTQATAFSITAPSVGYVQPYYINSGSGFDQLSSYGGTSRMSLSVDGAYTGLNITIVSGTGAGQTRLIASYHGASHTVFVSSPWAVIPDSTSQYIIWSSSDVISFDTTSKIAIATFPQPVKRGYVYEVQWYGCTASIVNSAGASSSEQVTGLPLCQGQLGIRIPKQGAAQVFQPFDVMRSDTVGGTIAAVASPIYTLAPPAQAIDGLYVGRMLTINTGGTEESRLIVAFSSDLKATVESAYTATTPTTASTFRIEHLRGVNQRTTVSASSAISTHGVTYSAREVDVARMEYPELIAQHRRWPHGYSYLQLRAGQDGELLSNLFLKDYTQYSTSSYYTDSVTIPKEKFAAYVRQQPNGVVGEFPFTIQTPPGKGNIQLLSIVISYPVHDPKDATAYDVTDIETKLLQSQGPPPQYPMSGAWSGVDPQNRQASTHPRFKIHQYTSTCGNGVHNAGEYCDDGNEVDGDGCSSACTLEAGWVCRTQSLNLPSVCYHGAQGSRVPDQAVGCKGYACQHVGFTAYTLTGLLCSGTPKDSSGNYIICLDGTGQGTCDLCIHWETERDITVATSGLDSSNQGPQLLSGGAASNQRFAGYDGRRRLLDDQPEEVRTEPEIQPETDASQTQNTPEANKEALTA